MKKYAYVILILFISCIALALIKTTQALLHPIKYQEILATCEKTYNLPSSLIASIINTESSFNENAKSKKCAIGLMQIKLDTANYLNNIYNKPQIDEKMLFTPEINIKYGCLYFNYLMEKFKNQQTALAAYNAGETRVRIWLGDERYSKDGKTLIEIPFKETANYVKKVEKNLKFYKNYL